MIDLYRFYDDEGVLLYVGISLHAAVRLMDHRRDKSWWAEVVQIEVEHLNVPRYEAARLDRRAIKTEQPRYNVRDRSRTVTSSTFECTVCGRPVTGAGFVSVPSAALPATGDKMVEAHRLAVAIAESDGPRPWLVEHFTHRSPTPSSSDFDVTLNIADVWALYTGARPPFARYPPEVTSTLTSAWENGEL